MFINQMDQMDLYNHYKKVMEIVNLLKKDEGLVKEINQMDQIDLYNHYKKVMDEMVVKRN